MSGKNNGLHRTALILTFLTFVLSSCALPAGEKTVPTAEASPTLPAPPTAAPARVLTVCLGEEPNTLYPFASPNDAALSVLAAIDDGPIRYS